MVLSDQFSDAEAGQEEGRNVSTTEISLPFEYTLGLVIFTILAFLVYRNLPDSRLFRTSAASTDRNIITNDRLRHSADSSDYSDVELTLKRRLGLASPSYAQTAKQRGGWPATNQQRQSVGLPPFASAQSVDHEDSVDYFEDVDLNDSDLYDSDIHYLKHLIRQASSSEASAQQPTHLRRIRRQISTDNLPDNYPVVVALLAVALVSILGSSTLSTAFQNTGLSWRLPLTGSIFNSGEASLSNTGDLIISNKEDNNDILSSVRKTRTIDQDSLSLNDQQKQRRIDLQNVLQLVKQFLIGKLSTMTSDSYKDGHLGQRDIADKLDQIPASSGNDFHPFSVDSRDQVEADDDLEMSLDKLQQTIADQLARTAVVVEGHPPSSLDRLADFDDHQPSSVMKKSRPRKSSKADLIQELVRYRPYNTLRRTSPSTVSHVDKGYGENVDGYDEEVVDIAAFSDASANDDEVRDDKLELWEVLG